MRAQLHNIESLTSESCWSYITPTASHELIDVATYNVHALNQPRCIILVLSPITRLVHRGNEASYSVIHL